MSAETYRLLLIEDVAADARLLEEALAETAGELFDLELALGLSEGMQRLDAGGVDLVLLDLNLPDSHGLETFTKLREKAPSVPVVVLTATDDVALAVRAVREGARDYLVKGRADGKAIVLAVRHAIERKRAQEASRRRAAGLEALRAAGLELAAELEPELLVRLIAENGAQLVGGDVAGLYLHRQEQDVLEWAAGVGEQVSGVKRRICRGEGVAGAAWDAQKPIVVDDCGKLDGRASLCGDWPVASLVAVPLRWRHAMPGVLVVGHQRKGGLHASTPDLLELFATQAAVALENARLYGELRSRVEHLEEKVQERAAELRSQAARAEAILMSSAHGIVVTDSNGAILTANAVAQEWLGQSLSPKEAGRLRQVAKDLALQAGRRPHASLALKGLDLELTAAPVLDEEGGEAAAVVNICDVTHLDALNRMRSRFLSDVSHELRTPVTAIKLYAELMRTQPERWREFLDALAEEADRQARLVGSILEISRIDAGRLEIRPEVVQLHDLVEGTIEGHRPLAEARGVRLEHRRASEAGVSVRVDRDGISRALNNLVENGIWYTPRGGRVVVSTGVRSADGRRWTTLSVEDSGVGIPEDELPRVFERFFRGEQARAMRVPGSGLGLAIVKEIVELHGGRVTVESIVNEGSTFTIWLPATGRPEEEGDDG